MTDSSSSFEKLRAFTVFPSGLPDAGPPAHVVIVPSGGALEPGFSRARELLRTGQSVHLVGHCATLAGGWPAWVEGARNFSISELGAYRHGSRLESTRELRASVRAWTDEIFGRSFSNLPGREAFYGSSFTRLFEADASALLFVGNLLRCHPTAQFHSVDSTWPGARMLETASTGTQKAGAGKVGLVARWAAAMSATYVEIAQRFIKGAVSLAAIEERRARPAEMGRTNGAPPPRLWLALTPDWPRINRPLIDTLLADAQFRNHRIGVLLAGNLFPGRRDEQDLRKHVGNELWPGIGELRTSDAVDAIEQIAISRTMRELVPSLTQATWRSVSALRRTLRAADDPRFSALAGPLRANPMQVAKLLTLDVFRTTEAERATERFLRGRRLEGATVIFSATTHAEYVVPDLLLQRAGARTVDFFHGWSGEPLPLASESQSTVRSVWARSDISKENDGQLGIVAGMPRRIRARAAKSPPLKNILFLSNYVHRDDLPNLPWALFQDELLSAIPQLRATFGDRFVFRWRPHPADLSDRIERAAARIPDLAVSRGVDLADDIGWCDALVSTMSTALVEALFAKIPIFGHVLPEMVGTPTPAFLDPERTFFHPKELVARIAHFEQALEASPTTALMPEDRALRALFGPQCEPASLLAALFPTDPTRNGKRATASAMSREPS